MKTPVLTPSGFELRDVPRPACEAGEAFAERHGAVIVPDGSAGVSGQAGDAP